MMNSGEMNLRERNFIFSGFASVAESQKLELIQKLQSLGGIYFETEYFKPSATHLIACQPSLSQKFLGACASGKWILLPKYIEDSFEAGDWLPEIDYEWNEKNALNSGLPSCMYSAPRMCREKVSSQKGGMFNSWKVAVLLRDRRRKMAYTRILELGNAQIVKVKLEADNFMDACQDLTHIFIDKEREESVRMLQKHEIPFVAPDFIRNFLLRDPPPSHWDFVITNFKPKTDYFSKFAIRIFSGKPKQSIKEQLKPVIKKLKGVPHSFVDNSTNISNDNASQNVTSKSMEEMDEDSMERKSINLKQEFTLNCTIADSVKLPGLSRGFFRDNKSKHNREKKLKSVSSDNHIRKTKLSRKNSSTSPLTRKVSSSMLNYFNKCKNTHRSVSVPEDSSMDSSVVSDDVKEKWKLYLQRRNFCLLSPSAFSHLSNKKFLESSEVSSSCTALFEPSLIEEEYDNAVDIANSFLSYEKYPQHHTLNDIAYKILQITDEEKMANKAFNFLHRVLYLHPPLNMDSRRYYIKALFPSVGEESLWKRLAEMISSIELTESHTTEIPQPTKNKQLLFSFIVSMLEQDFQMFLKSCSYPPIDIVMKNSRPLVISIFWNRGEVGSTNHKCCELFSLLAKSLSTYKGLKFQRDTISCLQHLVALVAECCQLSQREQKAPEMSPYLGPHCDKFALALVLTCSGILNSTKELMLLLTTLQSQWLKVKVCLFLLDHYFFKWHFEPGSDSIPLSLRKIVRQYMFPTPIAEKKAKTNFCRKGNDGTHLLARITDPEDKHKSKGETPLHRACVDNNISNLRLLLKEPEVDVNAKNSCGWTPLHEACRLGHLECVEELLNWQPSGKNKVDLLAAANEGITPLHDAVLNDHVNVASLLLNYGGKSLLMAKTSSGFAPMDFACSSEMSKVLKTAMKSDLEYVVRDSTEGDVASLSDESALSMELISATETLLSSDEVHKYLLVVLNLLLSYLEMHDVHKLTKLLRELIAEKEGISEDEQNVSSEKFLFTSQDDKQVKTEKNKQSLIYSLLERYLMHEPSLNTVLAVSDDLFMAQELYKYQVKYEDHLKTFCIEDVDLPKDLLCAIQLITV